MCACACARARARVCVCVCVSPAFLNLVERIASRLPPFLPSLLTYMVSLRDRLRQAPKR